MRLFNKKIFSWIVYLICGAMFIACGIPDPKVKEQSSNVSSPIYRDYNPVLQLSKETSSQNYEGSLIIWKPSADPKLVADALALSDENKAKSVDYVVYQNQKNKLLSKKESLANSLQSLKEKTKSEEIEFYKNQKLELLAQSKAWIKEQMKGASNDKIESYNRYCDVALLRFTISSLLRKHEFNERPMPFSVCEDSYLTRGYFETLSCEDGQKSYFKCFWEGGLAHKESFLKLYDKKGNTLASEEKVKFLNSLEELKEYFEKKSSLVLKIGKLGSKYKVKMKGQRKLQKVLQDFPSLFLKDKKSSNLVEALVLSRSSGEHVFSLNDILFNFPIIKSQEDLPVIDGPIAAALGKLALDEPVLVKTSSEFIDSYFDEKTVLKKRVQETASKILEITKKSQPILDGAVKLKIDGANIVKENDLAYAVWPNVFLAHNKKGDVLDLEFRIDHLTTTLKACYDLVKKETLTCEKKKDSIEAAKIEFDKKLGKLTILLKDLDPIQFGFFIQKKDEKDSFFHELSLEKIRGLDIKIELTPGYEKEKLKIFSGGISFLRGSKLIYFATLSFNEPLK